MTIISGLISPLISPLITGSVGVGDDSQPLSFDCDMSIATTDRISGEPYTPDYAGASSAINPVTGALIEAAADEHLNVPGWGVLTHAQHTQSFVSPSAPATQDITLGIGDFNCAILGTGSATVSAGTATITGGGAATEGASVAFTVTGAGTVTVTIAGTVDRCNVITGDVSVLPVFFNSVATFQSRSGLPYFNLYQAFIEKGPVT